MISLTLDLKEQTLKLARGITIKSGGDVPIRVLFTTAPASLSALEFALGSDEAVPATLAFTDTFTAENATLWTGLLDTTDSRLATALATRAGFTGIGELTTVIAGVRSVWPNVSLPVQRALNGGSEVSLGATQLGRLSFLPAVVGATGGGGTKLDGIPTAGISWTAVQFIDAARGLVTYRLRAGTDATAAPGLVRPLDYHGSTNARVWESI